MIDQLKLSPLIKIFILALAIVSIGGTAYFFMMRSSSEYLTPRIGPIVEAVYGLGTVVAPRTYRVKIGINSNVRRLYVKEGDQVRANDPLVQFDDSVLMRAPFAGTVTSAPYKEGELVTPLSPVLTVINLQGLYLEIALEQQLVLRVRPGQKAVISFESLRQERLEGRVHSVFPRDNQFIVRVELNKFPEGVLPGMTADVAIQTGRKDSTLMVPIRALFAGYVTVKKSGKTKKIPVTIGVVDGEWAEITSGNVTIDDHLLIREK
ncbi:MAG: efflux RND transporter periplasmic adaptor subunit [Bdellovibrio sp.]|nr:efflux RND transporter periplasmic adaptor subunit [Bdellovibrio sp.]